MLSRSSTSPAGISFSRGAEEPRVSPSEQTVSREVRAMTPTTRESLTKLPSVLIRSPYGRGSVFAIFGRLFAERGYTAVVQNARGTTG